FKGPAGEVIMQENHHLENNVYIGETLANGQFRIIKSFTGVAGEPFSAKFLGNWVFSPLLEVWVTPPGRGGCAGPEDRPMRLRSSCEFELHSWSAPRPSLSAEGRRPRRPQRREPISSPRCSARISLNRRV